VKFKNDNGDLRNITIPCASKDGTELLVQTRADGKKGLFIIGDGVLLSRAKALKLAYAILDELDPV
jgi:hypothetical protein